MIYAKVVSTAATASTSNYRVWILSLEHLQFWVVDIDIRYLVISVTSSSFGTQRSASELSVMMFSGLLFFVLQLAFISPLFCFLCVLYEPKNKKRGRSGNEAIYFIPEHVI